MSLFLEYEIRCNAPNCGRKLCVKHSFPHSPKVVKGLINQLHRQAEKLGWATTERHHVCPDCLASRAALRES